MDFEEKKKEILIQKSPRLTEKANCKDEVGPSGKSTARFS